MKKGNVNIVCRPNHDEVLARGLRFIEEAEDAEKE